MRLHRGPPLWFFKYVARDFGVVRFSSAPFGLQVEEAVFGNFGSLLLGELKIMVIENHHFQFICFFIDFWQGLFYFLR